MIEQVDSLLSNHCKATSCSSSLFCVDLDGHRAANCTIAHLEAYGAFAPYSYHVARVKT